MTNINFKACFNAEFEYDENKKLHVDSNAFDELDDDGQKIPLLDDNGEKIEDENGNLVFKQIIINAKEVLTNAILEDSTLENAGLLESHIDSNDGKIFEYEANLFDFKNEIQYETVETAAKNLISNWRIQYILNRLLQTWLKKNYVTTPHKFGFILFS